MMNGVALYGARYVQHIRCAGRLNVLPLIWWWVIWPHPTVAVLAIDTVYGEHQRWSVVLVLAYAVDTFEVGYRLSCPVASSGDDFRSNTALNLKHVPVSLGETFLSWS